MQHAEAGILVATLFLARDLAHREHLRVTGEGSFARHKALEGFYDGIVDLADQLAEAYQGCFDVILEIPLLAAPEETDIIEQLASQRQWIREEGREAIPRSETPLHNIVDEIEALYMSTLYQLRRLR